MFAECFIKKLVEKWNERKGKRKEENTFEW